MKTNIYPEQVSETNPFVNFSKNKSVQTSLINGIRLMALLCMVIFSPVVLKAQWNTNTSVNEEISGFPVADMQSVATTDGKTWVAFYHENSGNYDMRAQLFDADGYKLLGPDGMLVSNHVSGSATFVFNVCIDQSNNLIIAFQDMRISSSSYATVVYKISQAGTQMWGADGIVIGNGLAPYPTALSNGEVAVVWSADPSNTLNIQKITTTGTAAWTTPVAVTVGASLTTRGQLVANTNGSFTMVFQKRGVGISTTLYAQRFNNAGTAQYAPVQICNQTSSGARYYSIVAEGDVTYFGYYASVGFRFNSFLQRINADGTIPYGMNGTNFNTSVGSSDYYQGTTNINLTPGSAYVWAICTFSDPNQVNYGVYVQKYLKTTGARQFTDQAKAVYAVSTNKDTEDGAIALVNDTPMFMTHNAVDKIKATRLDANGGFVWPGNSVEISSTTTGLGIPKMRFGFAANGPNKCAGVWTENRTGAYMGYGQGVSVGGLVGIDVATLGSVPAVITVNQGSLQMVSTVYPSTASQNVTWSVIAGTGSASINSTGLLSAQVDGTVWAKATSVQDITMSDSLLVTLSGQSASTTPAPTGAASQTFCYGATVANLTATGLDIKWYPTPNGGTALPPTTLLINNNHYYASQTILGIESSLRLDVTVTIIEIAAPAGTPIQNFCSQGTVAELIAFGTGIQWYATATGGTPLAPATALVNGTHYYASQTATGCESPARLDVTVTITTPPSPPTGAVFQNYCDGATVGDLTAVGTDILWYSAPTGGSVLPASTVLTNGTHYYASQTVSGCESLTRFEITVNVLSTPAPSGSSSQQFCIAATVAGLSATGSGILWYASPTGGSPLTTTTALTNGAHYYASQTVSACESVQRLDVTVTISTVDVGVTQIGVTLTASAAGAAYQWMNCTTQSTIVGAVSQSFTPAINGIYAVIVTQNNCADTSLCISVLTVGLNNPDAADGIKVYPNPAADFVTIQVNASLLGTSYTLVDKLGRHVLSGTFKLESTSLTISDLSAGMYTLIYGERNHQSLKLMKK